MEDKDIVDKKDNYLLFDLKIDMDKRTVSYKLDGSIEGYSNIYEFNDDFSFNDDMIVEYMSLESSPDD